MFTYKLYISPIDKKPYLRLIPRDDIVLSKFGNRIYTLYDIDSTIIFINKIAHIEMSFYDHTLDKKILYKVIKFYIDNNIAKYINFKYNKKDLYWRIRFKITNTSLLLELL